MILFIPLDYSRSDGLRVKSILSCIMPHIELIKKNLFYNNQFDILRIGVR